QQCILARLFAANGYRVSMISFDYGQPSPVLVDGITVYKSFREDAGVPVLRFLHPRLTTMWRVLRQVDADVYYQRSSAMWTGVVWVGTIHGYKRPHWFLDIAERLPHRRFVMVGGPSVGGERLKPGYYEEVRGRAARLPNVEFTGFLPLAEVEPWFDRARLLVS